LAIFKCGITVCERKLISAPHYVEIFEIFLAEVTWLWRQWVSP